MPSQLFAGSVALVPFAAMLLAAAPPGAGGGAGGGGGASAGGSGSNANSRPRFHLLTPGFTDPRDAIGADVLLDRVEFSDGVFANSSNIVHAGIVRSFAYQGGHRQLQLVNGPAANVGEPGVVNLADQDLDGSSVSLVDCEQFPDRIKLAFHNRNLNNRLSLQGTSTTNISMILSFETRIWDSHFSADQRPEIFIFEEQGNSVLRIQALDEAMNPVGTAVEVRAVDLQSLQPQKGWVGRFNNAGALMSGAYEVKAAAIDLNRLGVQHVKHILVTNQIESGGESNADFKIFGIDTSPASAAQTICFD